MSSFRTLSIQTKVCCCGVLKRAHTKCTSGGDLHHFCDHRTRTHLAQLLNRLPIYEKITTFSKIKQKLQKNDEEKSEIEETKKNSTLVNKIEEQKPTTMTSARHFSLYFAEIYTPIRLLVREYSPNFLPPNKIVADVTRANSRRRTRAQKYGVYNNFSIMISPPTATTTTTMQYN